MHKQNNNKLPTGKSIRRKYVSLVYLPLFIYLFSLHSRCPMLDQSEYFSEESDIYTAYNSPASSCIDDPNVAAEVEM